MASFYMWNKIHPLHPAYRAPPEFLSNLSSLILDYSPPGPYSGHPFLSAAPQVACKYLSLLSSEVKQLPQVLVCPPSSFPDSTPLYFQLLLPGMHLLTLCQLFVQWPFPSQP